MLNSVGHLDRFITRLQTNNEYGYMIRKLVEPWTEVFATSDDVDHKGEFATPDDTVPYPNGGANGYSDGQIKGLGKSVKIPSMVSASLASEVAKVLLDGDGWVGPLSPKYIELCEFNWASNCHMFPTAIFRPANKQQVAQIMIIVSTFKTRFAIRSGGHQPCPGFGSVNGEAVLIDMSKLNDIKVARDLQTISFGPGGTWKPIYEALEGTGRSVIGGRTGDVGIGGLIIGGGLPSFSSEFGLVCDNVEEFEVVLADGSIVIANQQQHSDLFWALKGGAANFGIVTHFTLRTVPMDKIWFEARLYDASQNHTILDAIAEWQKVAETDPKASIVHHIGHTKTLFGFIYSKPTPYPDIYKMFYDIPYVGHFHKSTIGRVLDFSRNMSHVLGPPRKLRRNDFGIATRPSAEFYKLAHDKWRTISDRLTAETSGEIGMGVQPLTTCALQIGKDRGTNALNPSFEPQQWMNSLTQWSDDADDEKIMSAVNEFGDYLRTTAEKLGVLLKWVYLNNATASQDPIHGYGPDNVQKLRGISKKYDPQQVFQVLQSNGFLLRKVGTNK